MEEDEGAAAAACEDAEGATGGMPAALALRPLARRAFLLTGEERMPSRSVASSAVMSAEASTAAFRFGRAWGEIDAGSVFMVYQP